MKNLTYSLIMASALANGQAIAQERPNIILFLVDDMGVMDTSVPFLTDAEGKVQTYPLNEWYHTPHMERLAEQGIRFSTFYAQSVSSPSRTSIMTGQNAARHRTTNWINSESNNRTTYGPPEWNWEGLTNDMPVYPKLLQEAGYRTIHVGKAQLYNLKEDPFEQTDVAETNPQIVGKMIKAMKKRLESENALYPVDEKGNSLEPNIKNINL